MWGHGPKLHIHIESTVSPTSVLACYYIRPYRAVLLIGYQAVDLTDGNSLDPVWPAICWNKWKS